MKYLTNKEINIISTDYIYFKKIANKINSDKINFAFKIFQNNCMKKFESLIFLKTYRYRKFANYYDLRQDAFMALLAALNTFDPKKGSFRWWANRYIKTKVSRSANAHSTIRYPMKKAKENPPFKVEKIPIMIDEAKSPYQFVVIYQNNKHLQEIMSKLSSDHNCVVNKTFGCNGEKQTPACHIMTHLGISRSKYIRLLNEAKEEIKNYFTKLEIE